MHEDSKNKEQPLTEEPVVRTEPKKSWQLSKRGWLVVSAVVLLAATAVFFWQSTIDDAHGNKTTSNDSQQTATEEPVLDGLLQLDPDKNYGNRYADGILPVGDGTYVTDNAKKGAIYLCRANFVSGQAAGATTRGPWFVGTTQWDINKKYSVQGKVSWESTLTTTIQGDTRVLASNNLPHHTTGSFPVSSNDPAYTYDRNPNSIAAQNFTYTLPANPAASATPKCMNGGEVGVMLTGVALFNAFDAGGRDAGAWEIQDSCEGHPQASSVYHYHTLSSCINDVSVNTVIGFALDGLPITGPKVGDNNYLTTDDLDECHGIVSDVTLDGKTKKTYHYVMTMDFPYSVSCFRAEATTSPAQHTGGGQEMPSSPPEARPN